MMLELRPGCEHCARPLPPQALEARICSYECTFCAECVDTVLGNVCPNCGGGFAPRPIRPAHNWRNDNCLIKDPPGTTISHRPVDREAHARFAEKLRIIPPQERQSSSPASLPRSGHIFIPPPSYGGGAPEGGGGGRPQTRYMRFRRRNQKHLECGFPLRPV